MKVLLIIDFQRAVAIEPKAHDFENVRAVLVTAVIKARSQNIPVIFVQHQEDKSPFAKGGEGWKLFEDLSPQLGDYLVAKESCDSFRQTELEQILAKLGADTLIIGGYATEFCIDTSVRAAASRGYKTIVLKDGHTTRDRDHLLAEDIKRHHNWVWPTMTNPEHEIQLLNIDECF
ncbi:isochorismatase family protein [Kiloniella sp.]|uniref:isochorismatase family protein n=1 Tax=Kiloniella sp. TaxID=1938587 RepID=UPI003B01BDA7